MLLFNFFAFLAFLPILCCCKDTRGTIIPLYISKPLSNSTGVSFSGSAVGIDGSQIQNMATSFPYNASVDERVNKLRKDGHKSPSGRVILSLTLTSPLSLDPTRELTLPAIYDSSSAFNIIGEADAEMLDMPLGSECTVKWDGTT